MIGDALFASLFEAERNFAWNHKAEDETYDWQIRTRIASPYKNQQARTRADGSSAVDFQIFQRLADKITAPFESEGHDDSSLS